VAGLGRSWRILIPQEAYVFAGTLKENLTYLHPATKTELDEAAEAIGLTPLITRLGGYGAAVIPAALSAGERQLIALTRAYLPPARVVILDEATCHLDPAAEEQAEAAFARRGGTLIVIAHRISSARRARRILVLDGARPQVGDHSSLLVSSVMYADLAGQWDTPHYPQRTAATSLSPTDRGDFIGRPPSRGRRDYGTLSGPARRRGVIPSGVLISWTPPPKTHAASAPPHPAPQPRSLPRQATAQLQRR
jgi:ATP-binding cassette subfamily C protein